MTADLATYSEVLAPAAAYCHGPDPVRARVKCEPSLTNYEIHQAEEAKRAAAAAASLPAETRSPRPRRPHPGDVVYWATCLGGVCLLLLAATR